MRRSPVETLIGSLVIAVAVLFFVFAYKTAQVETVEGYTVSASFDRIDGIYPGSDVRLSGIKIGTVVEHHIDPENYLAVVRMSIDSKIKLPADSSLSITADGLLGNRYLAMSPGGAEETLPDGGQIEITQGAIDLTSLLGQLIFSQTGNEGGGATK